MKMEPNSLDNLSNRKQTSSLEKEKRTLQIEGRSIEVEKSYFEYPEYVQKETKIKGYTKYKISKAFFKNIDRDFQVEEREKKYQEALKKDKERGDYRLSNSLRDERSNFYWKSRELKEKIIQEVYTTLSEGEFPLKTYNHCIQGDGGSGYEEEVYRDKFILGEVTNIGSSNHSSMKYRYAGMISAVVDAEGKISNMGDFVHSEEENNYKFIEFKGIRSDVKDRNDIRIKHGHNSSLAHTISEDEFSTLTKDKIMISTMSGVYLSHGRLWGGTLRSNPGFGFDVKEDVFKNYLDKVAEIYSKLPVDMCSEKNIDSLDHLLHNKGKHTTVEVILPIMTGKTGIPALRWGHAKYAVTPTEKNFNLLVIDHLK